MSFKVTYSVVNADMSELNREFDTALASVREGLGKTFPSWIAGRAAETSEPLLDVRYPADTRVLLARFHRPSASDVERAVAAAHEAKKTWSKRPWAERVKIFLKAAELISERRMKLAAICSLEVGKTRLESLGDVEEAADLLRYYAGQVSESDGFTRPLGKLSPREHTKDVLKPYGVFAVFSPFNFPVSLTAGMSGAAMLAGNTVILKPSEATPWCAHGLYECFRDAGLPDGVLQVLQGDGATTGVQLSKHPRIDGIAFTGSTRVGMELFRIMSTGRVRPCLLEMGGKNAAVIGASAKLEDAVEGCARSAFGLSGQKCSALSRILVARPVYDRFLKQFLERVAAIQVGDPVLATSFTGPVINARFVERYEQASAEARKDGTVHAGGQRLTDGEYAHGHYVAPTVITVPRGHRLNREELFLPFVTVDAFETFDEALTRVNEADHGLTSGLFSQEQAEIDAFMDGVDAGILYANRNTGATTGAWPGVQSFCGWKASGSSGKGGCGPYYVSQFAREQSQTRMAP